MLNETNKTESFFFIDRKSEPVRIIRMGDRLVNLYVVGRQSLYQMNVLFLSALLHHVHGEIFLAT